MWLLRLRRFFKSAGKEALMLLWAFRHPATPGFVKLGTIALLLYAISPIDLVPDFPGIGWIDDAAILMLAIPLLLRQLPASVFFAADEAISRFLARFGSRSVS